MVNSIGKYRFKKIVFLYVLADSMENYHIYLPCTQMTLVLNGVWAYFL